MIAHYLMATLFVTVLAVEANAATSSTSVRGSTEDVTCTAYLHVPDGAALPLPLIFAQAGTGIYSMSRPSDVPSAVGYAFDARKAVVLTMDKPGIQPNPSDPEAPLVDDRIYNLHTQRDLIECGRNAINWARGLPDIVKNEMIFFGHSEGSMVLVRLYASLLESDASLAENVQALMLSGTPLLPWREIIEAQLADDGERQAFWRAFESQNDADLRATSSLPYAYWRDIFDTEPLSDTFGSIAAKVASASISLFHGMNDQNTAMAPVLDLENWNRLRYANGQPALHLSARYYNADHYLNLAAINDMIFMLLAYL